jgi:hypothetical protein
MRMAQTNAVIRSKKTAAKVVEPRTTNTEVLEALIDDVDFGTPEEIARDNDEWDAIIANTPPEKMAKLKQMFTEQLKRGEVTPFDFTNE